MEIKDTIAGMNLHYRYFPLKYFLDSMEEEGIYNIELWGGFPHIYYEDLETDTISNLKEELKARGQKIIFYTPEQCMYPINIASQIKEARNRSIEYFKRNIELAHELECDKVLITSGTGYFNDESDVSWKLACASLQELCDFGIKYGIKLGLEVLRKDESTLVNDRFSLEKMLCDVNRENIGAVLDTNPIAVNGEKISEYFDVLGNRIMHVHFIDGTPYGHLAWGDGNMSAQDYFEELISVSYKGYLTLEITDTRYLMNPAKAVHDSLYYLKNVLS